MLNIQVLQLKAAGFTAGPPFHVSTACGYLRRLWRHWRPAAQSVFELGSSACPFRSRSCRRPSGLQLRERYLGCCLCLSAIRVWSADPSDSARPVCGSRAWAARYTHRALSYLPLWATRSGFYRSRAPGAGGCLALERLQARLGRAFTGSSTRQFLLRALAWVLRAALRDLDQPDTTSTAPRSPPQTFGQASRPEAPPALLARAKSLRSGSDTEKTTRILEAYTLGQDDAVLLSTHSSGSTPSLYPSAATSGFSFFTVLDCSGECFWTRCKNSFRKSTLPDHNRNTKALSRSFRSLVELEAYLSGLSAFPPVQEK